MTFSTYDFCAGIARIVLHAAVANDTDVLERSTLDSLLLDMRTHATKSTDSAASAIMDEIYSNPWFVWQELCAVVHANPVNAVIHFDRGALPYPGLHKASERWPELMNYATTTLRTHQSSG